MQIVHDQAGQALVMDEETLADRVGILLRYRDRRLQDLLRPDPAIDLGFDKADPVLDDLRLLLQIGFAAGLAVTTALVAAVALTAAPTTANARGGIGTGAAVGIGLGAFALGSALGAGAYGYPYYAPYGYGYGYPGYSYYPPATYYAPTPYYGSSYYYESPYAGY